MINLTVARGVGLLSLESRAYYFGFAFEKLTFISWLFQAAKFCDKNGNLD